MMLFYLIIDSGAGVEELGPYASERSARDVAGLPLPWMHALSIEGRAVGSCQATVHIDVASTRETQR